MSASRTVSAEIGIRLLAPGTVVPLIATLSYSDDDPYAVRVTFHAGHEEPVEWVFARDLLRAGTLGRAGAGDVQAWPCDGGQALRIRLSSPFGEAVFEATAADVTGFLDRAAALVPEGGEDVDVDAELAALLLGGGGAW